LETAPPRRALPVQRSAGLLRGVVKMAAPTVADDRLQLAPSIAI
jgi:hypothetical protein